MCAVISSPPPHTLLKTACGRNPEPALLDCCSNRWAGRQSAKGANRRQLRVIYAVYVCMHLDMQNPIPAARTRPSASPSLRPPLLSAGSDCQIDDDRAQVLIVGMVESYISASARYIDATHKHS